MLPSNLLSPLTNATIETWSTQYSSQNWSRVFSIGSSTNNVMHMSFSRGTNINQNELRWNAQSNMTLQDFGGAPMNPLDEQVHWVVTINDVGGPNGETQVTVYKNGEEVRVGATNNDLSGLVDNDIFLGRSQWGDNTANASWDEFRIYDGILTSDQISTNYQNGPNVATDSDEDGISDAIENRYDFLDPENPEDAKLASAGLIFAIVGGALMPPLQGKIIDMEPITLGSMTLEQVRASFVLPAICFVVVAIYGFMTSGAKQATPSN